jgi:type III restriction enzyme
MKLKFKLQKYQTEAVESVVDCFSGQPNLGDFKYKIDPGRDKSVFNDYIGFKNQEIQLSDEKLLENIRQVQLRQQQRGQALDLSERLISCKEAECKINLDIEMETGTGKTYCYIKTIFELYQHYGWSKFIIVVPSIAIREGVYKSFKITAEHFSESYGRKIRFFIYNSKQLHNLESFSSESHINVMIINIQAFNATGKDNRRIYEKQDDFQSRRPIDVISENRPILILDEPQKMEGAKTIGSLSKFNPLMILRYSATHKTTYNKVHCLDALDAYNQKLVKKIRVKGISAQGLKGTNAYLYLSNIEISKQDPVACMEIELKQVNGIKRVTRKFRKGDNLFDLSGELEQYKDNFVISSINYNTGCVEFLNGHKLQTGKLMGDITENFIRRIQIRETIRTHLEKERRLFEQNIKVLSLFFIDEVAKYRDYEQADEKGEYAHIFEEEYRNLKTEFCGNATTKEDYRKFLVKTEAEKAHNGYFSIDKKTKRLKNPKADKAGFSDDVDAYDLILKDKEKLLSADEPTRFIFSHSALREGWDNPNVFVICTLKHSDNTISRRQEVGRGLRICVNSLGERIDNPETVHETNVLTVVANESYASFVNNLQKEMMEAIGHRPKKADEAYFTGKIIQTDCDKKVEITPAMAKSAYFYLAQNSYVDEQGHITETYHNAVREETLAQMPPSLQPYTPQIHELINNIFSVEKLPPVENAAKTITNKLNENFRKKEFQELWQRINKKAVYLVDFDSTELIKNSINALNKELKVASLFYRVDIGEQIENLTDEMIDRLGGFRQSVSRTEKHTGSVHSGVKYDLPGKIAENTNLTRKTIIEILTGIVPDVFNKFKLNPEQFISEASRLINEQKSTIIVEHLRYDATNEEYSSDIFTENDKSLDLTRIGRHLQKHIYEYAEVDSKVERDFVEKLDISTEVEVYVKLPKGFTIPTPLGEYNPDWAISFQEGSVKDIYFVAETKGSMSSLELRAIEKGKIECARRFFEHIKQRIAHNAPKYDVVNSFDKLMEIVKT